MSRKELDKYFPPDITSIVLSYNQPSSNKQHINDLKRRRLEHVLKKKMDIFPFGEKHLFLQNYFNEIKIIKINKKLSIDLTEGRYTKSTKELNKITYRCYKNIEDLKKMYFSKYTDKILSYNFNISKKYYKFIMENHGNCIHMLKTGRRCRMHGAFVDDKCKRHYLDDNLTAFEYYRKHKNNKNKIEKLISKETKEFHF